jgi:hypothetical protein
MGGGGHLGPHATRGAHRACCMPHVDISRGRRPVPTTNTNTQHPTPDSAGSWARPLPNRPTPPAPTQ